MSEVLAPPTTPVSRVVADARAGLPGCVEDLSAEELVSLLGELYALEAQVVAARASSLRRLEALGLPAAEGAASTTSWLSARFRLDPRAASRELALARALPDRPTVAAALGAGDLDAERARVVIESVAALPDPTQHAAAEEHLVAEARVFEPRRLRMLGRRVLDVVDPVAADAHEAAILERQEADAARETHLVMWDDGHGRTHGRFTIPTLHGAMLAKALEALTGPRHRPVSVPEAREPWSVRLGRGLCHYIERFPAAKLPTAGGTSATVVVTMTLDSLLGGLEPASLDTGERISAGEARRLACTAGIIPAVLGGESEVLDLGRTRRFYTTAQRHAMALAQPTCRAEGCDRPRGWCQSHHPVRWADGGETNVTGPQGGVQLCGYHHARAHDPTYETRTTNTGRITFHRRR